MIPAEFKPQKLKRKLQANGAADSLVAAGELLTRKRLGRPLFDPLVERGLIETLSQDGLRHRATALTTVPSESGDSSPFVAGIENGYLLSESGLALTSGFEIIEESAAEPEQAQQAMMAMLSRELFYGRIPLRGLFFRTGAARAETVRSEAWAAPLIPRYRNYYHWMIETVPKLRYLKAFITDHETSVTLLIRSDAPPFVTETLELLNWPRSHIKHADSSISRVPKLLIPSYPKRYANDFAWIKDKILDQIRDGQSDYHTTTSRTGNNVYVSRETAIERRVVNEDEVVNVLSEFGFSRYRLEERTVAENARLFANADVIVGPHGAGLTDILFSEGATLIELFGEKVKQPYQKLADAVAVDYERMDCTPDATDMVVDTEELAERVAGTLENYHR